MKSGNVMKLRLMLDCKNKIGKFNQITLNNPLNCGVKSIQEL
jgi:hypothetical protein